MPINLKKDYATKVCWGGIFQGPPNKSNLIYITQKLYCPTPYLPILHDLPILGRVCGVGNPVFQKTGSGYVLGVGRGYIGTHLKA